ncbi:S-adenosylmethionine decarboxylase [Urbifossiella limnaea]|uniref:S-adenosylmethionine decarboxylase proenzyme n=1 Tax=Urbifossiella limnaea TaxID=2528023 RepID=A0A517XNN2_9BACT|nr:S-adenosylmethionine decarboxylase [Urbifossiella limnaea]QDU19117.1 S-adenosylmethionine decarboxylase proenzyme precursor [Urbifossiella limnaea]
MNTPRTTTEITTHPPAGAEWVVEAFGCDPDRLRTTALLRRVCESLLGELKLTRVGEPLWHQFPGPGGVTGLYLLAESHLACHTFPEHGLATFNLYCCRPRPRWPWEARLADALGAARVQVREVQRGVPDTEAGR